MKLFCYGSNNQDQLTVRCRERIPPLEPAFLLDHKRVFRGWSERWQGGVASLLRSPGSIVYGGIAEVPDACMERLDGYEGVNVGKYVRKTITVLNVDEEPIECQVYVSTSKDFNAPSEDYLEAVVKTVGKLWSSDSGGDITIDDFKIE